MLINVKLELSLYKTKSKMQIVMWNAN